MSEPTKAAHTPGPWVFTESLGKSNSYKIEGDGLSIKIYGRDAFLPSGETAKVKRTEANARLVAAAPDLLLACQDAAHSLECQKNTTSLLYQILQDAIRKAAQ